VLVTRAHCGRSGILAGQRLLPSIGNLRGGGLHAAADRVDQTGGPGVMRFGKAGQRAAQVGSQRSMGLLLRGLGMLPARRSRVELGRDRLKQGAGALAMLLGERGQRIAQLGRHGFIGLLLCGLGRLPTVSGADQLRGDRIEQAKRALIVLRGESVQRDAQVGGQCGVGLLLAVQCGLPGRGGRDAAGVEALGQAGQLALYCLGHRLVHGGVGAGDAGQGGVHHRLQGRANRACAFGDAVLE